jgi:hypothetical protein
MFSKTNVTLETCTQDLAKEFAAMPALEGERELKPAHLTFLDGHRRDGTFVDPTWAVVVDKTTGTKYRANGQHSSTMLANCPPEEYPAGLMVTIEEYTTDDLAHDAALIFDLFDHPRSVRDNVDVMNLHRAHYPDLKDVPSKLCLALCNGIAAFEADRAKAGDQSAEQLPIRQRGGYLQHDAYREFVRWAATFAAARHAWLLNKPGVVAEMVANHRSDSNAGTAFAEDFWGLVFTESHPDSDHETRELSRTLRELVGKPRVKQDRFRKEAGKQWRRFRKSVTATPPTQMPLEQSPPQDSASA